MMISIFKVTTTGAPMKSITTTTFALTLALVGCGDQAEPSDVDATSPDAAPPTPRSPTRRRPTVPRRSCCRPRSRCRCRPPARISSRAAVAGPNNTFFAVGYAAATPDRRRAW
jgi:hypothetical protein